MLKKLLLALSLITCVHAQTAEHFDQTAQSNQCETVFQNKQPLSARQQKKEDKALKRQQRKLTRKQRKKRGWGIALGIGLLVLVAVPLLLFSACIGGGLSAIK
jgi:Flp pilus assembly protein TadB